MRRRKERVEERASEQERKNKSENEVEKGAVEFLAPSRVGGGHREVVMEDSPAGTRSSQVTGERVLA